MSQQLAAFLKPETVAIIGASRDPSKRGARAIATLLDSKFTGRIVPINPRESEILSLPCYPDLVSVPYEIDLALVCTPAQTVPDIIEACGAKGVKAALVLAGGFGEAGEAGRVLETEILARARRCGVRLIGPNTNGMFDGHTGCNLVGWPNVYPGSLGVLSQSGNVALSLLAQSYHNRHAGFSTYIGVGNETDIQFHEYLTFFAEDKNTRALMIYAEGFKNGRAFLDIAREVSKRKPIVVYKAGRTGQGKEAALSHSGSLAGDYAVTRGALEQAGLILVERSDEIFAVADTLARFAPRPAKRVAVLSEGGGPISQAVDTLAERRLELPRLDEATEARLKTITPAATQLCNPVDAGGGTDPDARYIPLCGRVILASPQVDALLVVGFFGGYQIRYGTSAAEVENVAAREIVALAAETGKPIIVQCHYADSHTQAIDILRAGGVIVVRSIEIAAACLAGLDRFHHIIIGKHEGRLPPKAKPQPNALATIEAARKAGRKALLEPEALKLLASYGIEVPETAILTSPEGAGALPAALLETPVALKIVSKDILHKSEVDGVVLGISGRAAVRDAAAALLSAVASRRPDADLTGVLVAPMARKGVEIILGKIIDRQFGPVIMLGLGGIFVEALNDVVFRSLPISHADAEEMIDSIRAQHVLNGLRGAPPVDRAGLAALIVKVAELAIAHPEIAEIDLNPVIVVRDDYAIVDACMVLACANDDDLAKAG